MRHTDVWSGMVDAENGTGNGAIAVARNRSGAMTSELKPCPFCGRVPHRTDDESDIYYIGHDVDCYIVRSRLWSCITVSSIRYSLVGRAWERRDDE